MFRDNYNDTVHIPRPTPIAAQIEPDQPQTIPHFAPSERPSSTSNNCNTTNRDGQFLNGLDRGIGFRGPGHHKLMESREHLTEHQRIARQKFAPPVQTVEQLVLEQNQHRMGPDFQQHQNVEVHVHGGDDDGEQIVIRSFDDCHLTPEIMHNLSSIGFHFPTAVQRHVIPLIQKTNKDLMCLASTGSGKTGAFLIPIINRLQALQFGPQGEQLSLSTRRSRCPKAIIIAHTKELVPQIVKTAQIFANGTGIGVLMIMGSMPIQSIDAQLMRDGCDIVVATPGRLGEFVAKDYIRLEELQFLVVDEMDKFFSDPEFVKIFRELKEKRNACKNTFWSCRTLMFSATLEPVVSFTVEELLHSNYYLVQAGPINQTVSHVRQEILLCNGPMVKKEKLVELLRNLSTQRTALNGEQIYKCDKTVIFINEGRRCDRLAVMLCYNGFNAISINGHRTLEQRTTALRKFNAGEFDILVGTDVIGRGVNLCNLGRVILYELPPNHRYEQYIHRVGRVGRLGNEGTAIVFFDATEPNDCQLAEFLTEQLTKAHQGVPLWLQRMMRDRFRFRQHMEEEEQRNAGRRAQLPLLDEDNNDNDFIDERFGNMDWGTVGRT